VKRGTVSRTPAKSLLAIARFWRKICPPSSPRIHVFPMTPPDPIALMRLAQKYIWWTTPDVAITMPERVVAQVMNIGDYDDVHALATLAGDDYLRAVLQRSEIGQFTPRSWAYWHYRLGLATPGSLPAMPARTFV
jgi:hypothetical protein